MSVLGQLAFCLPGTIDCPGMEPARLSVLASRVLAPRRGARRAVAAHLRADGLPRRARGRLHAVRGGGGGRGDDAGLDRRPDAVRRRRGARRHAGHARRDPPGADQPRPRVDPAHGDALRDRLVRVRSAHRPERRGAAAPVGARPAGRLRVGVRARRARVDGRDRLPELRRAACGDAGAPGGPDGAGVGVDRLRRVAARARAVVRRARHGLPGLHAHGGVGREGPPVGPRLLRGAEARHDPVLEAGDRRGRRRPARCRIAGTGSSPIRSCSGAWPRWST